MKKAPKDVAVVNVWMGFGGFRYTCRNSDGNVVYDSPYAFRGRRAAAEEVKRRWPNARVTFEVT